MKIDKSNGLPKFFQLKKIILDDIDSGKYPIDSKLPTERAMMKIYSVSSVTVARAMKELVDDGIVRRRIGDGSYAARKSLRSASGGTASPKVYLCSARKEISPAWDPCNWFVENEIRRGVLDASSSSVNFANFAELDDLIASRSDISVVLINPTADTLMKTRSLRIPHVIVDQAGVSEPDISVIKWNLSTGVFELISHLINVEGHKRVGLIAGASDAHKERVSAYEVALKAHELQVDSDLVVKTENGSDLGGYCAMRKLLELSRPPTAVFVDTDLKAAGAIKAVEDLGLKVPDDVSIAGFDDMPGSDALTPPLTTVKAPYYEMGVAAAELLEQKKGTSNRVVDVIPVMLTTQLVIRNSTAKLADFDEKRSVTVKRKSDAGAPHSKDGIAVEDKFARKRFGVRGPCLAFPFIHKTETKINDWHHSPPHRTFEQGTYMVTAGTYGKILHFTTHERLDFLTSKLLQYAAKYSWNLQAWAVMENHYHFVGFSQTPGNLSDFISSFHTETARYVNALDNAMNRRVWFQYWDSHITFQKSYYARLKYVHNNPVHHGILPVAEDYPWCSAGWFNSNAPKSFIKTVEGFKIDKLNISDDF